MSKYVLSRVSIPVSAVLISKSHTEKVLILNDLFLYRIRIKNKTQKSKDHCKYIIVHSKIRIDMLKISPLINTAQAIIKISLFLNIFHLVVTVWRFNWSFVVFCVYSIHSALYQLDYSAR